MDKRKGDLIYIPSNVTLLQFDNTEGKKPSFANPKRFLSTTKPRQALLVKQSDLYCKVLYDGEYWFVESRDIYDS